jgi:hypothetical protein
MFGMFSVHGYLEVMCRFEGRTKSINILNEGMPRGAKMSLALNEPEMGCSLLKFKDHLRTCTTTSETKQKLLISYANNQWKIIGDQLNFPRKVSYVRISYAVTIRLFAAIVVLRCLDPILFATQESDKKRKAEGRFFSTCPPSTCQESHFP